MKITNKKIFLLAVMFLISFTIARTSSAVINRDGMMVVAESYKNHLWTASIENVCSNKRVGIVRIDTPDKDCGSACYDLGWWDSSGATNKSIPYKWGGFNTLASFDDGIRAGACGGDVYNKSIELSIAYVGDADAVGIDCSGFVSRTWNLKSKKSTRSLPNISKELGKKFKFSQTEKYQAMKNGDIFNISGDHVMLCAENNPFTVSDKVSVYEASGNDWKVWDRKYTFKEITDGVPYHPYTFFPAIDIEIVIDRSGSMEESFKEVKKIVNYFADVSKSNTKIGIVSFANFGYADYPLTLISDDKNENKRIRSEIKEIINNRYSNSFGGETRVGEGLRTAWEELNEDPRDESVRAIILISDGYESAGGPFGSENSVDDILPQIIDDEIIVYTVKINEPISPQAVMVDLENNGKLNFQTLLALVVPDWSDFTDAKAKAFLKNIAAQTDGKYHSVKTLKDFYKVHKNILQDLYQQDKVVKILKGKIKQNEMIIRRFVVSNDIERTTFALSWPGSNLDFTLIDPDGVEITSETINEDISFALDDTYKIYEIDAPINGEWQLKIYGEDVSASEEEYIISVSALSGMEFQVELDKTEYFQNDNVQVSASVIDQILDISEIQYVYGAEMEATIENPDGQFHLINLFDSDNDGIYTGVFSGTLLMGDYELTVEVQGNSNDETGNRFERMETLSFAVNESQKKNVVITVPDKSGSIFDEIILEAEIKDEQGEQLSGNANKASFKVGDEIIGDATIDESGQAKINWIVDIIPEDLFKTYFITVAFNGNENYFSSSGEGEFILKSAQYLKQETIPILQSIETTKISTKKLIASAVKSIEKSLEEKYWQDSSRLNSKIIRGIVVFNKEKAAVLKLKAAKKKDNNIEEKAQEAINKLVKADKILSEISLQEAKEATNNISNPFKKRVAERSINKSEKEMERAEEFMRNKKEKRAINFFKRAWIFSKVAEKIGKR